MLNEDLLSISYPVWKQSTIRLLRTTGKEAGRVAMLSLQDPRGSYSEAIEWQRHGAGLEDVGNNLALTRCRSYEKLPENLRKRIETVWEGYEVFVAKVAERLNEAKTP